MILPIFSDFEKKVTLMSDMIYSQKIVWLPSFLRMNLTSITDFVEPIESSYDVMLFNEVRVH